MDSIYCVVCGLNIIQILLLIYMMNVGFGVFCFLFLDFLLSYCPDKFFYLSPDKKKRIYSQKDKFFYFVGVGVDIFFIGQLVWDFLEEGTESVILYYVFLWVLGVYLIIKNLLFYGFYLQIINEIEEEEL